MNLTCGWLTHGKVLSFASPKESTQRKGDPGRCAARKERERCPALLANTAREPNSPAGEKHARSGSNTVSRNPAVLAAVLGLLYGDLTATTTATETPRMVLLLRLLLFGSP